MFSLALVSALVLFFILACLSRLHYKLRYFDKSYFCHGVSKPPPFLKFNCQIMFKTKSIDVENTITFSRIVEPLNEGVKNKFERN